MPPKRARQQSQEPEPSRAPKRSKAADGDGEQSVQVEEDNAFKIEDDAKSDASGHSVASVEKSEAQKKGKGKEKADKAEPKDTDKGKEKADKAEPKDTDNGKENADKAETKDTVKDEQQTPVKDYGYGDATNARINKIRSYFNLKSGTAHISKAAAQQIWTKVEGDTGNHYLLAQNGTRTPTKIWMIGNVAKTYFYDANGDPPSSISINVAPLEDRDKILANNFLSKYSVPRDPTSNNYPDVRFSKWTAIRRAGEEKMTAEVFAELYDARNGFILPRDKMPHIAPKDLKKGDLVLVEATVARWHPRKDGKSKKTMYTEYNAYYCINFIALLDDSPAPQVLGGAFVPEEEDEVEF